jgi:hypothetical protein
MALFRPSTVVVGLVVAEALLGVLLVALDLQVRGNKINMFPSLVNLVPFPCFHLPAAPPTSTSAFAFCRWDRRASLSSILPPQSEIRPIWHMWRLFWVLYWANLEPVSAHRWLFRRAPSLNALICFCLPFRHCLWRLCCLDWDPLWADSVPVNSRWLF